MKTLFISLFVSVSVMTNIVSQDTEKITASFDTYEDGVYYFVDADGYTIMFNHISKEAKTRYDLTSDDFIGKSFEITYFSENEMDEFDEEISVQTIVSLKLLE